MAQRLTVHRRNAPLPHNWEEGKRASGLSAAYDAKMGPARTRGENIVAVQCIIEWVRWRCICVNFKVGMGSLTSSATEGSSFSSSHQRDRLARHPRMTLCHCYCQKPLLFNM
eukprot:2106776-Rhodomonas_salina.2